MKGRTLVVAAVMALGLVCREARADDSAAAETAFQEGRRLVEEKRYAEACPKFAESHKLEPAVGTLLNLGDCHQRAGQYASAWVRFVEAIGLAQKLNRPDREKAARDRAMQVESRVSRVTITARDAEIHVRVLRQVFVVVDDVLLARQAEVKRDGVLLDEGALGTPVPVDPGKHMVEARAKGKKLYTHSFEVPEDGQPIKVEIPLMLPGDGRDDPPVAAVKEPKKEPKKEPVKKEPVKKEPPPPPVERSSLRTVGLVVAGVGVVGVGLGTFFGLRTFSKWKEAQTHCTTSGCDQAGFVLGTDAKGAGTVSTISFIAGGALLVGGAAMFFIAPSGDAKAKVGVGPSLDPRAPGLAAAGTF